MKYKVDRSLYEAAVESKRWNENRGGQHAGSPEIPQMLASWILLKCEPVDEWERPTVVEKLVYVGYPTAD
jgi:hypothetical protein